jgi:hypothetical protein
LRNEARKRKSISCKNKQSGFARVCNFFFLSSCACCQFTKLLLFKFDGARALALNKVPASSGSAITLFKCGKFPGAKNSATCHVAEGSEFSLTFHRGWNECFAPEEAADQSGRSEELRVAAVCVSYDLHPLQNATNTQQAILEDEDEKILKTHFRPFFNDC